MQAIAAAASANGDTQVNGHPLPGVPLAASKPWINSTLPLAPAAVWESECLSYGDLTLTYSLPSGLYSVTLLSAGACP
jgi:hypothetical protein